MDFSISLSHPFFLALRIQRFGLQTITHAQDIGEGILNYAKTLEEFKKNRLALE